MASLLTFPKRTVRLLDAGAGSGSLAAAAVAEFCRRTGKKRSINVTAYEIDEDVASKLKETMRHCKEACDASSIGFESDVVVGDFIADGVGMVKDELFHARRFDCAILNPPYKKLSSNSEHRRMLRSVGVETSNLYTAFLALAIKLLDKDGELVAIVPRSFCNGPYFRPFRELLLDGMSIRAIHVFGSRKEAFQEDQVLQENIIFHAVKTRVQPKSISITSSQGPNEDVLVQEVLPDRLVNPNDPERFIHILTDESEWHISELMGSLSHSLNELGLSVSTGKVVDFRAKDALQFDPEKNTVPLIYPVHFKDGWIEWPRTGAKKPNAIVADDSTANLLIPPAIHVLVKRFSAKEEKRRVVASIFDPSRVRCRSVGFENHLNYYHAAGAGLSLPLAKGLAAFLNCSMLDAYFRQFNGHTQVNATDLRNLKYPAKERLEKLGKRFGDTFPEQNELDRIVERELLGMTNGSAASNSAAGKKLIEDAISALKSLGLPKEQQNERSGLTLLALLGLKPGSRWSDSEAPLMGITPMMDYFAEHFGKKYAPNSRETVRRFTVHQFEQAGIIIKNPDKPRPVNSPDNVYQVAAGFLELMKTFGTLEWKTSLDTWLETNETLREKYAAERAMQQIPVKLPGGGTVVLSQEGQNILIKHILEEFCSRFTPGAEVLYIGDTGDKYVVFEEERLAELEINIDRHGKMPDAVVYYPAKGWLLLIEAVTSHGPVNAKRHKELKALFAGSTAGLVFVTAFLDRAAMRKYLPEIAWETEVWCADAPTHIIHFNGERFLGPY